MFPSDLNLAPKLIMRGAIPLPPIRLRVLRSDNFAVAFIQLFDVRLSEMLAASNVSKRFDVILTVHRR